MTKSNRRKEFDLSIVIPALNEERRIGDTLDELADFLRSNPTLKELSVEVVVVSADGVDRTHQIVETKEALFDTFVFLKPGRRVGKGRDVQYGMLRARGNAVVFMDADLATPLRHLPKFYKAIVKGNEVVIGTRNIRKHHKHALRIMVSNVGNFLFRIAGGLWIEDSQCGFKMFNREAAQVCFSKLRIMKWGFDMEILAIAKANRYKIKSYRINDWKAMPHGTFEEGFLSNSVDSLGELTVILKRRISGAYKK